jgi:glycosyltransferase involved in cell wall biosynthesis
MTPLVSYIVLSYQHAKYVGDAVMSLLNQTERDLEVIVVDDCSTDGSRAVLNQIHDSRLKVHFNARNKGGASAYNQAIDLASGQYIGHLDSDDIAEPSRTRRQLEVFAREPKLDVLGTWVRFIDDDGQLHYAESIYDAYSNREWDLNLAGTWLGHNRLIRSSVMFRADFHSRFGPDDETLTYAADYEMWTRALAQGARFDVLRECLTRYRVHERNVTTSNPDLLFLETAYLSNKNLIPLFVDRGQTASLGKLGRWFIAHERWPVLPRSQRAALLTALLVRSAPGTFDEFQQSIRCVEPSSGDIQMGERVLALLLNRFSEPYRFLDCTKNEDGAHSGNSGPAEVAPHEVGLEAVQSQEVQSLPSSNLIPEESDHNGMRRLLESAQQKVIDLNEYTNALSAQGSGGQESELLRRELTDTRSALEECSRQRDEKAIELEILRRSRALRAAQFARKLLRGVGARS